MRRLLLPTVLLLAALVLAGCGSDDGDDEGGESSGGQTVEVVATEFAFDPADVSVDEAGETTFTVSNEGEFPHALEIEGNGIEEETEELAPGESGSVTVELEPGEYELYCPVGDHRDRGMVGTLVVGGAAAGAGGSTTDESESESDDPYGYG
ncbi:MAG TPA: cupredoxin domain-containing protein [Gaiellaceae bacterium]|nr:cupredoxin domain-containing protein [Gaiellaceae bacterium]